MTTIYAYTKDSQAYVGKTKNPSRRKLSHNKRFNNWEYKELDIIPSVKKEDWKPYETAWIQIYNEWGYEMLNQNKGGGGCLTQTDEAKAKISQGNKGLLKLKQTIAMTGKKHSEETKAKMSASAVGKPKSQEHIDNVIKSKTGMKYNYSLETKIAKNAKLSEKLKGRKYSEETIAKMSASAKNKKK